MSAVMVGCASKWNLGFVSVGTYMVSGAKSSQAARHLCHLPRSCAAAFEVMQIPRSSHTTDSDG